VCVLAENKVQIPEGVTYKSASKETNARGEQKISKVFTGSPTEKEVRELFGQFLICGPFLWKRIKDDPHVAKIKTGVAHFKVPVFDNGRIASTQEWEGKLFQNEQEIAAFWAAFKANYKLEDLVLRKLNSTELRIYWAMIPYDIEEPVFILQTKSAKILLQLTKSKLELAWMDDYQNVSFRKDEPRKKSKRDSLSSH